jgi:hypothetical protein
MGNIVWLASYPKSGNTWMRIFLTNYWRDADEPADINFLDPTPIASGRYLFDEETGVESSDLTWAEIQRFRPGVYQQFSSTQEGHITFCKIHDAYTFLRSGGDPVFPPAATRGVIYIIRNPLSVAVSWANHSGITLEKSIETLASSDQTIAISGKRLAVQLPQRLLSWSGHAQSWIDHSRLPLHVVRYEDMKHNPLETFTRVIEFLITLDPETAELDLDRVQKSIAFSSFDRVKAQEAENGFNERLSRSTSQFFRKGSTTAWRDELSNEQIERIIDDHRDVMRRFGYLDTNDTPIG